MDKAQTEAYEQLGKLIVKMMQEHGASIYDIEPSKWSGYMWNTSEGLLILVSYSSGELAAQKHIIESLSKTAYPLLLEKEAQLLSLPAPVSEDTDEANNDSDDMDHHCGNPTCGPCNDAYGPL